MILKIIGSVLIILASCLIGYAFSRDFARRPQELRALQRLLQIFETEISFLSIIIPDAFEKIGACNDNAVADFFIETARILKTDNSLTAGQAWEKAVGEKSAKSSLDNEDINIVLSFGKLLGGSDLEGQIKNIRLTMEKLKIQEEKAEEKRLKNESMCKSLGLLGGLALAIILI
ncbi:MAG TPA: stage III sporulation protein SpoIIIAB [Clostridia bacterium]